VATEHERARVSTAFARNSKRAGQPTSELRIAKEASALAVVEVLSVVEDSQRWAA